MISYTKNSDRLAKGMIIIFTSKFNTLIAVVWSEERIMPNGAWCVCISMINPFCTYPLCIVIFKTGPKCNFRYAPDWQLWTRYTVLKNSPIYVFVVIVVKSCAASSSFRERETSVLTSIANNCRGIGVGDVSSLYVSASDVCTRRDGQRRLSRFSSRLPFVAYPVSRSRGFRIGRT